MILDKLNALLDSYHSMDRRAYSDFWFGLKKSSKGGGGTHPVNFYYGSDDPIQIAYGNMFKKLSGDPKQILFITLGHQDGAFFVRRGPQK